MRRDPATLGLLMDKADVMHKRGYNCAETAVWALSSYWNLDLCTACVTGFGGGVARTGAVCGALAGAIAALGSKVGRVEPEDDAGKQLCYRLGQKVIERFRERVGSTDCKDIIGFVLADPGGAERYAAGGFKDGVCRDAIRTAVDAAIQAWEDEAGSGEV